MFRALTVLVCASAATASGATSVLMVGQNDLARELASELSDPLEAQGLKVKSAGPKAAASLCIAEPVEKRPGCLAGAARLANSATLLIVGAEPARQKVSVTLSLLSGIDGALLGKTKIVGPKGRVLSKQLSASAKHLSSMVKKASELPKVETVEAPGPKQPVLVEQPPAPLPLPPVEPSTPSAQLMPQPPETTVTLVEPSGKVATHPLRVLGWVSLGVAAAATATAIVFGMLGLSLKSRVDGVVDGRSMLMRSEATALASEANGNFAVALVSAIGAGVFGVGGALMVLTSK